MSNIKKLLEGVEVEWKALGEVCDINTGQKPPIIEDKPTNFDYINAGTSKSGYCKNSNCDGDTVTTPSRGQGGIGYVGYQFNPFWLGPLCYKLKSTDQSILINKFLFYFLQSECQLILGLKKEGGAPAINKYDLANILIPIPPLEIQKEIVRILDKFSMLTAELQAELQARKSQYEYYRNQLLNYPMEESDQSLLRSSRSATPMQNGDNATQPPSILNPHTGNSVLQPRSKVKWKTLGEIAEYSHKRINAATMRKTNYVGVDNLLQNKAGKTESNYVPTEGNLTAYTVGDILIGNIRPYLKKIWLADNDGGTNGDVLVIHLTDKSVNMRYLYQVLADDNFFVYNMQYAKGAKMPRGNKQKIMEYPIPIPSPEEQERIVSILDKFDTLTNSITEGLPKEIELRQKQYEYYRDMLLSFPKNNIKA